MPPRTPVSPAALKRYAELCGNPTSDMYRTGSILLQEFPGEFAGLMARSAYQRCAREMKDAKLATSVDAVTGQMPQPQSIPATLKELILPYRDMLVICDMHLPFHYEHLVGEALTFAKSWKLKRLCLGGDAFDFNFFSMYDGLTQEKLEETWVTGARFYEAAFDHGIQEIHQITGNHEHRFERKTGVPTMAMVGHIIDAALAISPSLAMAIRKRVTFTNMFWCRYTDTPDGIDWAIEHQWNHRQVRGSTVSALVQDQTECHTITGHEHHYASLISRNNRWYAVACPTMQNPNAAEYMVRRKRVGPKQVEGFGWVIDGRPGLWWDGMPEPAKARLLRAKGPL